MILKKIAIFIVGTPIAIIFSIINYFYTVRIGLLYSSRIGHLIQNVDHYLTLKKRKKNHEYTIFILEKIVSNKYIVDLWNAKKNLLLTKNFFLRLLLSYYNNFLPNSKNIIRLDEQQAWYSDVINSEKNIDICSKRKASSLAVIRKLKIRLPFICIHNRDPAYIDKKNIKDPNFHDFRDFKFDDYSLAIKNSELINVNFLRIGEVIEKKSNINNSNFMSLIGYNFSNKYIIDIALNSKFMVSGNSGIAAISRLLRKPHLYINYAPFNIWELSHRSIGSIFVPKKIWSYKSNRYLFFKEMFQLDHSIHHQGNFYEDNNLKIIDNTQEEISMAIHEMYLRTEGKWKDSEVQKKLQNKFWQSIESIKYSSELRDILNINLSSTFLEKNFNLID